MASEWIGILVDGRDMRAYLSRPETTGKVPGVVVITEDFGVNKHIQEVTDKLSREGYVAVAPVLYHRLGSNPLFSYTGEDADARTGAMGSLRDAELRRDFNTTIASLKGHARVKADRLGIVGFCVGGRIAYLAATSCPGLSAAVVYYGGRIPIPFGDGPAPFERAADMQCPAMGNFGEDVAGVVVRVASMVRRAGSTADPPWRDRGDAARDIYGGTSHDIDELTILRLRWLGRRNRSWTRGPYRPLPKPGGREYLGIDRRGAAV